MQVHPDANLRLHEAPSKQKGGGKGWRGESRPRFRFLTATNKAETILNEKRQSLSSETKQFSSQKKSNE